MMLLLLLQFDARPEAVAARGGDVRRADPDAGRQQTAEPDVDHGPRRRPHFAQGHPPQGIAPCSTHTRVPPQPGSTGLLQGVRTQTHQCSSPICFLRTCDGVIPPNERVANTSNLRKNNKEKKQHGKIVNHAITIQKFNENAKKKEKIELCGVALRDSKGSMALQKVPNFRNSKGSIPP